MQTNDGKDITLLGGSSSIKLKYEESSGSSQTQTYTVASHNISSAPIVDPTKLFTFFLIIICILFNLLK
ncbi:hypothetical protein K7X08_030186 [Anisodus acutangulus]|uniref:Uncharacterized protein n=1 Tax=Anisodus acutangulus TaxID=402998 RepID=A0A9Q1LR83_9SOLA|nr:hypothetical protein K7X08_030186 [Anisodus acutangulus]